ETAQTKIEIESSVTTNNPVCNEQTKRLTQKPARSLSR
ncbi:hypothetical protein MPH_12557, partial [Macrophomina phaseolina MS6]